MKPCADRLAFLDWASGHPGLTRGELAVLNFLVHRIVGRITPSRGWAKFAVLVEQCGCCERTVRRALISLEQRGWIARTSVPGRGGSIFIDLPLAPGAAKRLQARPLGKADSAAWLEALPGKTPATNAGLTAQKPLQQMQGRTQKPLQPLQGESPYWPSTLESKENPLEGVAADAGDRDPCGAGFKNGQGNGMGLRQDRAGPATTYATERLLKRLKALASKGGQQLDLQTFLAEVGEGRFRYWLRLQSENRDPQLVNLAVEAIIAHTLCDPVAFGTEVGRAQAKRPKANGHRFNPYGETEPDGSARPNRAIEQLREEIARNRASAERLEIPMKPKPKSHGSVFS